MKFLRKKLKNGMTVIMEKRELPVVSVSITNRFGAAFEESKIKGIAHVIEHMLFTGTKTRSHEDISREIEKRGGVVNAFTANEITSFLFKLPSEHIFSGLTILADILTEPTFDKGKFEKEKKVILEEIKMYHDDPQRDVYRLIEAELFDKPFGEGIIGSKESVSALDRDFVKNYFISNYNPSDYIVTLVGDADFDKVCEFLEEKFSGEDRKGRKMEIKKKNGESVEEREGIDQAHFIFAVHAPLPNDKDYMALQVLDAYLAEGMSSKLFLKIREEKGLAYAVRSSLNAEKNYSYYSIYAGTKKEAIPEIKKIILEEFEKVENEMSEKDLEEAKNRLIGLRKVSSEESMSVMHSLIYEELIEKAENYYNFEAEVRKVKLKDVKRAAKISKYSTAAIVPK